MRNSWLQCLALGACIVGAVLFITNETILVEGHKVGVHNYDEHGQQIMDEKDQPVVMINPAYIDYQTRKSKVSWVALSMIVFGGGALAIFRTRKSISSRANAAV